MIRNSFKIAWRNLIKDRQFSLLNLVSLSTGLACAILIFLWVKDEKAVDKFNEKDSRLYQVIKTSVNADGTMDTHESTPCLLAQSMANEIPEVEYAVAVVTENTGILSNGKKYIKAKPQFADKDFFNVFSYQLIEGDKSRLLSDKHGVFISGKLALKLFNTTSGIAGKTVIWDGEDALAGAYTVSSVFKSPPFNASVPFDIVFTFALYCQS